MARYLVAACLLCLCSSCFQVIEEITMKQDGSGEMQLTLNLSQSKSKLASIMLVDSMNGYRIPKEKDIHAYMNETVDFLKKANGISNIKKSVDLKNYIASVSFSFKDVSNINGLTQKLLRNQKAKMPANHFSFDKTLGAFKRNYQHSQAMKTEYNKLKPKVKEVFTTASFTSIFRFDKAISSSSNKMSKISPSGKAIMFKTSALSLINGTANISNQITLAR